MLPVLDTLRDHSSKNRVPFEKPFAHIILINSVEELTTGGIIFIAGKHELRMMLLKFRKWRESLRVKLAIHLMHWAPDM